MASDIRIGVQVDSSQIKRLTSDLQALTTQASTLAAAFRAIPGIASSSASVPGFTGSVTPSVSPLGVPVMPPPPSAAALGPAASGGGQMPPTGASAAPLPPAPTPGGPGPAQQPLPVRPSSPGAPRSRPVLPAAYAGASGYGGGLVRGLLGFSVLAGGGYFLGSAIRGGIERESGREMNVADLYQRTGGSFGKLNEFTTGQPTYGPEETTQFAGTAIGRAGMRGMGGYGGIGNAMARNRAFGFGTEEGAEMFGGAARQFGSGNTDKFAGAIAKAIKDSEQGGLQGEVFESILRTNEELNKTLGMSQDASNAVAVSIAAVIAGLGPNNRNPALTGAGLVETLGNMASAGKAHSLFNVPDVGTALLAQAGQRSGMDFFQTNQALQFEPMGENWKKIMGQYIQGAEGMGPLKNYALEQMGIPVGAAGDLMKAVKAHGINSKEAQGELEKLQKQSHENAPQSIREAQAKIAKDFTEIEAKLEPLFAKFEDAVAKLVDKGLLPLLKFFGLDGAAASGPGAAATGSPSGESFEAFQKKHGFHFGSGGGGGGGGGGAPAPSSSGGYNKWSASAPSPFSLIYRGARGMFSGYSSSNVEENYLNKYKNDPDAEAAGQKFAQADKKAGRKSTLDAIDSMEVQTTKGKRVLHIVYKGALDDTTYAVDIPVTTTAKIPKAGAGK